MENIMPSLNLHLLLLMFFLLNGVQGFVKMTCNPTETALGEASTCTCTTDSGSGIVWQKNGVDLMLCNNGGICDISFPAYDNGYSTSGTNKVFTITIKSFGYSDCSVYTCKDQDSTDTSPETLSVYDFNPDEPLNTSEPGDGNDGNITITTGCLFKSSDVVVEWYSFDGDKFDDFQPKNPFRNTDSCSDATKICGSSSATTLTVGFTHKQKKHQCGQIKVVAYHSKNSSAKMEWRTNGTYCIVSDCECSVPICIVCILFWCLGFLLNVAIVPILVKGMKKKFGLGIGVSSICMYIVSIGACASKLADECCESEKPKGIAFLALSCAGVIACTVLLIYICMRDEKGPDDRPGHGHGGRGAPLTHSRVHADHEEKSLSARGGSDSEVSRQDVDVRKNRENILEGKRPMPPIPLDQSRQKHDSKGRGLSANYDDDHPMISIGIPEKKKGDLGPLQEEPKKKKKKKKRQEDDDDYDEE